MAFFDFDLRSTGKPAADELPAGGVVYGSSAIKGRPFSPSGLYAGAKLDHLVGESDSRFPSGEPLVVELSIDGVKFNEWCRRPPSDWWPLLETLRSRGAFLRVPLAPNASTVSNLRRLARMEPKVRYLVDPFQLGPESKWSANLRLAEAGNIYLTTLGAAPGPEPVWVDAEVLDRAFHFLCGEVGAGKLLFASGADISSPDSSEHVEKWLTSIGSLDQDQRRLIQYDNVAEIFSAR